MTSAGIIIIPIIIRSKSGSGSSSSGTKKIGSLLVLMCLGCHFCCYQQRQCLVITASGSGSSAAAAAAESLGRAITMPSLRSSSDAGREGHRLMAKSSAVILRGGWCMCVSRAWICGASCALSAATVSWTLNTSVARPEGQHRNSASSWQRRRSRESGEQVWARERVQESGVSSERKRNDGSLPLWGSCLQRLC